MTENPTPTGSKLPHRYFGPMPDWETDLGGFVNSLDFNGQPGTFKIIIATITDYKGDVFNICTSLKKIY